MCVKKGLTILEAMIITPYYPPENVKIEILQWRDDSFLFEAQILPKNIGNAEFRIKRWPLAFLRYATTRGYNTIFFHEPINAETEKDFANKISSKLKYCQCPEEKIQQFLKDTNLST
jgi:hypothetical protein